MNVSNVYFDVCGTLFKVNTTFDFICFFHKKKSNILKRIYCFFLMSIFCKILHRLFKFSLRNAFFKTISNVSKFELYDCAEEYIEYILKYNKIPQVFSYFDTYLHKPGYNVILVSAAIDPVISTLANRYGIEFYCSKLEYINNNFSGKLVSDLKGKKKKIIEKEALNYIFYSDNYDDLICSDLVKEYIYIVKKGKNPRKDIQAMSNVKVMYV